MVQHALTSHSPDAESGYRIAQSLWDSYRALGIEFSKRRLLDFGCSWGYFCALALQRGCSQVVGVDIRAHWLSREDAIDLDSPDLRLYEGNILDISDLQAATFDLIVSSGTLFLLDSEYLDQVLRWFFKRLVPGGEAAFRTRCITAKSYNDLGSRLNVPGAQLLFSRRMIDQVLNGKGVAAPKFHVPYTGATWIMACRCAGFEVVDVRRHGNRDVVGFASQHPQKLQWIDPLEVATGEITVRLKKPLETRDLSTLRRGEAQTSERS